MTNKEKAVTAATVHGKIIKYSICIVADFKDNVKMKIKICLCRKCGRRYRNSFGEVKK